jgi:hypothetical protein
MGLDQEFDEDFTTHDLGVEFSPPSAGWIDCRIRPMHELFAIKCSYIWDPFERFIGWLEAIASGSDAATWLVDQEGSCSRVQFYGGASSVDDPADYLLHLRSYGSLERVRGVRVERRQLVDSFYSAFRAMADSSDYAPREWERHPDYASLESMEDDEYNAALHAFPYGGNNLRKMRSSLVEAYLAK